MTKTLTISAVIIGPVLMPDVVRMKEITPRNWTTISIPGELYVAILDWIRRNPERGYASASDLVRDAVRELMDKSKR